jgi:hypothetical protein
MNTKRLLILATFLETVPEHKFDLMNWRDTGLEKLTLGERLSGDYMSNEKLLNNSCGTTGCAIGWACTIPEFIKDGFTWSGLCPILTDNSKEWRGWSKEWYGLDAILNFFNIDESTTFHLFEDNSYDDDKSGSKDVANRIREVVYNFSKG